MNYALVLLVAVAAVCSADPDVPGCLPGITPQTGIDILQKKTWYYCGSTYNYPENEKLELCYVDIEPIPDREKTSRISIHYLMADEQNPQDMTSVTEFRLQSNGWYLYKTPDTHGTIAELDVHGDCLLWVKCIGGQAHKLYLCDDADHCHNDEHPLEKHDEIMQLLKDANSPHVEYYEFDRKKCENVKKTEA